MLQCVRQPILAVRNRNQVDMIRHEAIANQRNVVGCHIFPQQLEVDRTIRIAVQHKASRISTLR